MLALFACTAAHFALSVVSLARAATLFLLASPVSSNPRLNELLHMSSFKFKSGDEFDVSRPLTKVKLSNLAHVIRDRADTLRLFLSAVWMRYRDEHVRCPIYVAA